MNFPDRTPTLPGDDTFTLMADRGITIIDQMVLDVGGTVNGDEWIIPSEAGPGPELGDVDGNDIVNIVDALQIARYDAGISPDPFYESAADVDCNSSINIVDALQVARYDAGIISSFC